jgi:imidazolonepropionase-like amidohydrolase
MAAPPLRAHSILSSHILQQLNGGTSAREPEVMVKAGMSPAQGIVAATSRPAESLRLDKTESLVPGKDADFLVLDANPLDDDREHTSDL